jgi:hypothetical protein
MHLIPVSRNSQYGVNIELLTLTPVTFDFPIAIFFFKPIIQQRWSVSNGDFWQCGFTNPYPINLPSSVRKAEPLIEVAARIKSSRRSRATCRNRLGWGHLELAVSQFGPHTVRHSFGDL